MKAKLNRHNFSVKLAVVVAVLFELLTGFSMPAHGQIAGSSSLEKKDTSNNADQNLKSIARINPSTLAMEFSLPIVSYPGRSGTSLSLGLNYSSKVWRMETGKQWWYRVNSQTKYVTELNPKFAERSAGGWTSTMVPPRIEEKIDVFDQFGQPLIDSLLSEAGINSQWMGILGAYGNNILQPCGTSCSSWVYICPFNSFCINYCASYAQNLCENGNAPYYPEPPPPTPLYYIKRYQITMSDGSTHEFRQNDTKQSCGSNQTGCSMASSDLYGTYLSVDDSGMRFEKSQTGHVLFIPGGGKFLFPSSAQQLGEGIYAETFVDVNGNKLAFTREPGVVSFQKLNRWTDSIGRVISDPMPQNWEAQTQTPGTNEVYFPTLNGETQKYEFTWDNLKPVGCEESTDPNCTNDYQDLGGALEDQTQKLFHDGKYKCFGSNYTTLNSGEILFPEGENGTYTCAGFNIEMNSAGEPILDENGLAIPYSTRFNPVVLSEVKLPNGKSYKFKYNRYGEITKIIHPSGSVETFEYQHFHPIDGPTEYYGQTNRGVSVHRIFGDSAVTIP